MFFFVWQNGKVLLQYVRIHNSNWISHLQNYIFCKTSSQDRLHFCRRWICNLSPLRFLLSKLFGAESLWRRKKAQRMLMYFNWSSLKSSKFGWLTFFDCQLSTFAILSRFWHDTAHLKWLTSISNNKVTRCRCSLWLDHSSAVRRLYLGEEKENKLFRATKSNIDFVVYPSP